MTDRQLRAELIRDVLGIDPHSLTAAQFLPITGPSGETVRAYAPMPLLGPPGHGGVGARAARAGHPPSAPV